MGSVGCEELVHKFSCTKPQNFKGVSGKFKGCFEEVSRVFLGNFREIVSHPNFKGGAALLD